MNFPKIIVLCGVCAAMSYAGISIHIDGGKKKKHHDAPPPPPPRWSIDERSCDGPTCCDLHIDGVSSEYDLRCNERIEEASVKIRSGNGSNSERLKEGHGRLRYTLDRDARAELRVRGVPRVFKERMCDNGICCDFEQDSRSRDYKIRCDRPYDRVDLLVKAGGRKDHFALENRGRLPVELRPGDRCELRITPPPPPPPPAPEKKKKKGVDIHIRL